jgi:hypothetical protein
VQPISDGRIWLNNPYVKPLVLPNLQQKSSKIKIHSTNAGVHYHQRFGEDSEQLIRYLTRNPNSVKPEVNQYQNQAIENKSTLAKSLDNANV